jgi:hypothetical protein
MAKKGRKREEEEEEGRRRRDLSFTYQLHG